MNRAQRRQQKKLAQKGVSASSVQHIEALQKGIAAQQQGDHATAEQVYKQILQIDPENAEANHLMGTLAHQLGRHDLALAFLERAVSFAPQNSNFHNMVGVVARETGDLAKAQHAYEAALNFDPQLVDAHNGLGLVFKQAGNFSTAISHFKRAIQLNPNFAGAYNNLGNTYEENGDSDQAIKAYEKAIAIAPELLILRYNLARCLQTAEKLDQAITIYQQITEADPSFAAAFSNYGKALRDNGNAAESIAPLQKVIELEPNSAEGYYELGLSLAEIGHSDEALACYEGAIALKPDFAHAHNDHGVTLLAMGRAKAAAVSFNKAIEIAPRSALMHSNLGNAYIRSGDLLLAQSSYEKALSLNDKLHQTYNSLAVLKQEMGEFAQAQSYFDTAIELKPTFQEAVSNMLFSANYDFNRTGEDIFKQYEWFNTTYCEPLSDQRKPHLNVVEPDKRLRVGYVAPTFYRHAVSYHLMPLFDNASHQEFEVFAYADIAKTDEYTAQYRNNSDHFEMTRSLSDEQLANKIREDEIDILVDIAGHTKNNRLGVFARKPAPVALHWLDFGYTTGMPTIDYYVGDHNVTPEDQDHLFGEKEVWRLDGPSVVYRPRDDMGDVSELPALKNGYVTFCTLSRTVRLNDPTIRAWAEILKRVPDAKIRFDSRNFSTELMCDRLAARFAEHGIDRDRLTMGFSTPPWNTLREIDIALDCFPHNSGTTLFEHLYMGNPYVTLYNRASVGTLGGAILRGGGFDDWVAHSEEEYVDIAVKLASDIPALAEIRRTMRNKMKASPLMDEKAFVERMEGAYREMWRRWCSEQ